MRIRATHQYIAVIAGLLGFLSISKSIAADTSSTSPIAVTPTTTATVTQPKLPYGVDDVLKLSRAQVGDDIIVNYVKNSGTIYSLAPADIAYLKKAGVSDRVLNAMLDQRKLALQAAVQTQAPAPTVVSSAPTGTDANMDSAAAPTDQAVQAPLTPPASTVTVIPYPAASAAYYGYYYPYYGYYSPGISFGFGFAPGYYYGHGYYGHGHGYYGHGSYAVHGGHGGGGHGGGAHHR